MNAENGNINNKNLLLDEQYYIKRVHLPPHEVERLTGVDRRKLRYWTQKGFLESKVENGYRYGFREVRKAALIDRYISGGLRLGVAAERAKKALNKAEMGREEPSEISQEKFEALSYEILREDNLDQRRKILKEIAKRIFQSPEDKSSIIKKLESGLTYDGKEPAEG